MADASFQQEFLKAHNAYRAKHNTPPLSLSSELTTSAQKWADHLLEIRTLTHSGTGNGENCYYAYSSGPMKLTGKKAVDDWYSEIKDYNWSSPGNNDNTDHFSQVVWKGSTELGVGMATDGHYVYVIGQYRPAGNIKGSGNFVENVLPLGWADACRTSPGARGTSCSAHCGAVAVHSLLVTVWLRLHQMDFLAGLSGEQPNTQLS